MAGGYRLAWSWCARAFVLAVQLARLPCDLLFLTWDFVRLLWWALVNFLPWLFEDHQDPFEPLLEAGVVDESREGTLWALGLARKYGTKSLLRLLFTGLRWHEGAGGRCLLCWCGTIGTPPTTPRRSLLAASVLAGCWGSGVGMVLWLVHHAG